MLQEKMILHIDDDQDDRFLVAAVINDIDPSVSVREAADGLTALDFLNQAKLSNELPCLIILDYNMPGMNGIGTYKEIRKDPQLYTIPVVLLTTFCNEKDIAYWQDENVQTFTKPTDFDEFKNCINKILSFCKLESVQETE